MNTIETMTRVPTWRRIAASTWGMSDDPAIYGWMDVDATRLLAFVDEARRETGRKITVTHVVGKAAASAFADHPECNALVSLGRLKRRTSVDVFFSVAVGDGKNLTGAKVAGADRLSVGEIARSLQTDVARIRGNGDTPLQRSQQIMRQVPGVVMKPLMRATASTMFDLGVDLTWAGVPNDPFGTVIVSNVGVLGVEQGFAPLMPQSRTPALLTVGRIRDKVIPIDGEAVVRPVLTICGTFDHRVVDGYHLGKISDSLRTMLENPESLNGGQG